MALFLSTFINKIDKKGRVSVPAPFRTALGSHSFQGIALFRSYNSAALEGSGLDRMARLSQSVDTLDLFSQEQDDLAAVLFADTQQLPFDGEGRIMIPQELLDHAGIIDQVCFVGRGATFQIWNPDTFTAHQVQARERLKQNKATLRLSQPPGDGP